MLVRPTRAFPGTFFLFRGSAVSHIWPILLGVMAVASVVTYFEPWLTAHDITLTETPFAILGVAISIFLGFRNNACYDRWWEARKLWGLLINRSRIYTRQVQNLVADDPAVHREMTYQMIGFVHALRLHLRDQFDRIDELVPFVGRESVDQLKGRTNIPNLVLSTMGERVQAAWLDGKIHAFHVPTLDASLTKLADIQGGCERIKNTPVPLAYTMLTHRIIGLYCLTLPLGLVGKVGAYTPLAVGIIAFAFLGLDAVGSQIEDPFEEDPNDLPLLAISRMIEVNLKEQIGETDLPEMHRPENGILV